MAPVPDGPTVLLAACGLSTASTPLAVPSCAPPLGGRRPADTPLQRVFAAVDAALEAERARGFTIGMRQPAKSAARVDVAVRAAVQAYVQGGHQDWRELASFCDQHYVRHLVDESANVEMMLICWKKGQASRVHNHGSSHCYLTVLSGGVEELRFTTGDTPLESEPTLAPRLPGVIAATSPCPLLLPDGVNHVCVGTTAYINDSMGLHAVRCDDAACGGPGAEEGAVSLHIYAPPIRRVRLYEPEADRVVTRAPGFRTIRGVEEEDQMDASLLSSTL